MSRKRVQKQNNKAAKADIYLYISMNKRSEGEKILQNAGYLNKPSSPLQMAQMLAHHVSEKGEPALMEIAKIHPDYNLIVEAYQKTQTKSADGEDDDECLNCLGADGDPVKTEKNKNILNNTQLLIVSGALVLSIALVALIVVNKN
jgi:hypothetical protein